MIVTERRNIPVLFCGFEGQDGQKLSYVQPFTSEILFEGQIEILSIWYGMTDHNVEICGSQSQIMTACGWYDRGSYDLSVYDDYYTISKEKKTQSQHDSTVWIIWTESPDGRSCVHVQQMKCQDIFEDLLADRNITSAYICETAEVADELMARLSSI